METKKSPKVNLEKTKTMGALMGGVVALAVLFVGFEWGTNIDESTNWRTTFVEPDSDLLPITSDLPPPPPPPPPALTVAEVINVVDDGANIDPLDIPTTEDGLGKAQPETYIPPTVDIVDEDPADFIFNVAGVEEMPEFPGGDRELMSFIAKSIKYPVVAQGNGIQGRVTCAFVVNKDGSIVNAEVLKGVDISLDREALRVINSMPKWKPGMQRGKPVRVKYTIPITFKLQQ